MAGFKRDILYVLDFEAWPDLAGLEIKCKPMSMGKLLEIASLSDAMNAADARGVGIALDAILTEMAGNIVSWNLQNADGQPLSATVDTLADLDAPFQKALIQAWNTAHSGVTDELGKDSVSGEPSLEVSLPMERMSPNPASL